MGNELLTKEELGRDSYLVPTTLASPKSVIMSQEIVFEDERREYVLDALTRGIDDEGYVIGPNGDRVLATDGDPIKSEDIGYIGHGSTDFVRDDISQIREYLHESD